MNNSQDIFAVITGGGLHELQQLVGEDNTQAMARDANGVSALMTAAYYRKQDMVEFLRGFVSDLDVFETAALGDEAAMKKFITYKCDLAVRSPDGFTPLHLAAFFNHPSLVKLLLDAGAGVNAVAGNPSAVQPLHSAAACGSVDIVKLLLEHGADVNARQHGGWTALQSAAKHGNLEMLEILLQHGGDPNQPADDGQTAVTMAANDEIKDLLLQP